MPVYSISATHLVFQFSCPYTIKTVRHKLTVNSKAKVPTLSTLQWRLCHTAHGGN